MMCIMSTSKWKAASFVFLLTTMFSIFYNALYKPVGIYFQYAIAVGNESNSEILDDVFRAEILPTKGKSIFFLETSRSYAPLVSAYQKNVINYAGLTIRQACAIESAAMHNPNQSVFVLYASQRYKNRANRLLQAVLSYDNVYLRNINLLTFLHGSPIFRWIKNGKIFKSRFLVYHLSDLLRFVTLWRWSGTYMDFDTITLKSVEKLPLNYAGIEREQDGRCKIGAGVLNLAYNALGEQVANLWLNMFNITHSNTIWGASSVETVTNAIRKLCGDRNMWLDSERVCGFHIFNYTYFYAIDWWNWKTFFRVSDTEETLNKLKYSYVAHLWSAHSRNSKGCKNCAYNILIKRHCPNVYQVMNDFSQMGSFDNLGMDMS